MSSSQWRLFRIRPGNHPRARIVGGAHLVSRYLEPGLLQGLRALAGRGSWRELEAGLVVSRREGGPALIGKGRAGDMAVNVVLPFLHAWAVHKGDRPLSSLALSLFRGYPCLQGNRLTRNMEEALFPAGWLPLATSARRQQGLLYLDHLMAGAG